MFKEFWNPILEAMLIDNRKMANQREIARHLSRMTLYRSTDPTDLNGLYPDVREKAEALIKKMADLGMPVVLHEAFRPASLQDSYYLQGRSTPGSVITNAKGLQSYHQYGLAFDLIFQDYGYTPPSEDWWDILGRYGQSFGLTWGGAWSAIKDRPHFEWHPGFTWQELEAYFKK